MTFRLVRISHEIKALGANQHFPRTQQIRNIPFITASKWLESPIRGFRLAESGKILAWLEIDLSEQLRFAAGLVPLTDRRLLAIANRDAPWQAWPYRPGLSLQRRDHAGGRQS